MQRQGHMEGSEFFAESIWQQQAHAACDQAACRASSMWLLEAPATRETSLDSLEESPEWLWGAESDGVFVGDWQVDPPPVPYLESTNYSMVSAIDPVALPSLGSAQHAEGTCKPCAFAYEGCANGAACLFCHLCPPGELKRRKRNKLAARRRGEGRGGDGYSGRHQQRCWQ